MQGVTGFVEPKREHSRKPETMRKMIERVSYTPLNCLRAEQRPAGRYGAMKRQRNRRPQLEDTVFRANQRH